MSVLNFFQCYLFAWAFWTSLTVGCVGLLCLHHAVKASWALPILRVLESGAKLIPIMGLLFIPIIMQVFFRIGGDLYPWTNTAAFAKDPVLKHHAEIFSNPLWFLIRNVIYFSVWTAFTYVLTASEIKQDKTGDLALGERRASMGAWGIVLTTITVTFAWTDWVMSLDPHWYSTMFGAWFLICGSMNALAFAVIYVTRRAVKGEQPWVEACSWQFRKDVGSLLLMFAMIWAYFSLSQFLIIWSGNLPEDNTYYTVRFNDRVLDIMGGFLIFSQWLFPFIALLAPKTKRATKLLYGIAIWIICTRFIDVYWTIMPFFMKATGRHTEPLPVPMTLLALGLGLVGGIGWVMAMTANMKEVAPLPTHDPRLQEFMEATGHAA